MRCAREGFEGIEKPARRFVFRMRASANGWICKRCCMTGRSVPVIAAALSGPRCDHRGELVFDYLADQQLTGALEGTSTGLGGQANGAAAG